MLRNCVNVCSLSLLLSVPQELCSSQLWHFLNIFTYIVVLFEGIARTKGDYMLAGYHINSLLIF